MAARRDKWLLAVALSVVVVYACDRGATPMLGEGQPHTAVLPDERMGYTHRP